MKHIAPFLLASLLLVAAPAWADVSRDQAAAIAQRETGGRVLAVDRAELSGRPVWRVKVVTRDGNVQVVLLDAATGRPL